MKCQRCLRGEAAYRVHSDAIDMKVCAACADEAKRLGIAVEVLGPAARQKAEVAGKRVRTPGLPVRVLASLPLVTAIELLSYKTVSDAFFEGNKR